MINYVEVFATSKKYKIAADAWSRNFEYDDYVSYTKGINEEHGQNYIVLSKEDYDEVCIRCNETYVILQNDIEPLTPDQIARLESQNRRLYRVGV